MKSRVLIASFLICFTFIETLYAGVMGDANNDNKLSLEDAIYILQVLVESRDGIPTVSAPIPKTGQANCWNEAGDAIPCDDTGQDGELQKGITWPTPRFTDNTDGTITDNLTGLMWMQKANCINTDYPSFDADITAGDGRVTWQHALDFVAGINSGTYSSCCSAGYTDWRLPNVKEMSSLIHHGFYNPALSNSSGTSKWTEGDIFTGVQPEHYWTSTSRMNDDDNMAWEVNLYYGRVYYAYKSVSKYVWAVRGGQ